MPSQATPLPIVPAAQPAKPARDTNPSQAAGGFDALVSEAERDLQEVRGVVQADPADDNVAPTSETSALDGGTESVDAQANIAEASIESDARSAAGSGLEAWTEQAKPASAIENAPEPPVTAPQAVPGLETDPIKAGPVEAASKPSEITNSSPEPTADRIPTKAAPERDIEAPVSTEVDTADAPARDARVAETPQRVPDPQINAQAKPVAPAKPAAEQALASAKANPDLDSPKEASFSAKADPVASDGEPADADILAPLKEARPASERTPGELIRGDARAARSGTDTDAGAAGAKSGTADSKSSAGVATAATADVKPAPTATPQVSTSQPLPSAFQAPPLDLLLNQAQLADASLAEPPIDPALSKSDALFDPAAARTDARTEIRTASTLQFAQGPRLTPQSAQTMAAQIAQRFNDGGRVFDIRLDPPELGRVEVRLEVGKDNSVRAVLAAERTETLAELQRSARDLERALTEAGLDVGEDALSFSLTDDSAFSEDAGDEAVPETPVFMTSEADIDALAAPLGPISTYGFLLTRAEGLDVSV